MPNGIKKYFLCITVFFCVAAIYLMYDYMKSQMFNKGVILGWIVYIAIFTVIYFLLVKFGGKD